jgi:hypothetical protein
MEQRTNINKGRTKKTCQATILEGLDVNKNKWKCKAILINLVHSDHGINV